MTLTPVYHPSIVAEHVPSHSGPMTHHKGLILHVQQGTGSLRHEFSDPAREKSSTWWVSRVGRIEEYVQEHYEAWAQADGNPDYNSVESEGWLTQELTLLQVAGLSFLYRRGHVRHGWPFQLAEKPGQHGLGWHGMGGVSWGNHPNCPGDLRKAERATILGIANSAACEPVGPGLRHEVVLFKEKHGLDHTPHIGSAVRQLLSL